MEKKINIQHLISIEDASKQLEANIKRAIELTNQLTSGNLHPKGNIICLLEGVINHYWPKIKTELKKNDQSS